MNRFHIFITGCVLLFPQLSQAQDGVVLLHGLCRTKASMKKMEASLIAEGYRVANVGYPSRTRGIEELSNDAIPRAMSDLSLTGCKKMHFVTHSLGGILVRSYFKRNPSDRLGRVVMLGPPNQGSEVIDRIGSWWISQKINGPAAKEIGTRSSSIPNQLGPVNFELAVIAGDRSINWINSVMIAGPDDGKVSVDRTKVTGMKSHLVVDATHPFLMKNNIVILQTIQFLKTGSFSAPGE